MKECSISNCNRTTTRWGALCSTHRNRKRRHGHPSQTGVTKTELSPFRTIVQKRRAKNSDSSFWASLESRWTSIGDHARRITSQYKSGVAMIRTRRKACEEIVRVADNVDSETVIETALAMMILQQQMPHRFRSDDAFRHQFARRVRGLTDLNSGTWFDRETGRVKRVYRDIPAKTAAEIGQTLIDSFGYPGMMLARKEQQDIEQQRQERQEIASMVEALR